MTYHPPTLGIDVGKEGGFCLMSYDGQNMRFWRMPLIGGKVTSRGVANVYQEIHKLCREPPKVFIERVFAKNTDGKVGMSTYFLGAGFLEMPALWDWPITTVSPATWCRKMHAGLPKKMEPKEKSLLWISQKYPELYKKGSDIWPERMKKPHLGLTDALLIASWGRLYGSL